jgi:hypothetical protein
MDLEVTGLEYMDWNDLVQDRDWWWALVNIVMDLLIP